MSAAVVRCDLSDGGVVWPLLLIVP
jgi:hypothetical protein